MHKIMRVKVEISVVFVLPIIPLTATEQNRVDYRSNFHKGSFCTPKNRSFVAFFSGDEF